MRLLGALKVAHAVGVELLMPRLGLGPSRGEAALAEHSILNRRSDLVRAHISPDLPGTTEHGSMKWNSQWMIWKREGNS